MSINCFAEGSGSCRIESIPGAYVYANVSQVGGTDWLAFTVNAYGVEDGMVTVTVKYNVPYMGETYSYEIVKTIEFKDGKAVNCKAEKGEEILKQMISMDEGASYLGEVALVEVTSPINLSNILFYNT